MLHEQQHDEGNAYWIPSISVNYSYKSDSEDGEESEESEALRLLTF